MAANVFAAISLLSYVFFHWKGAVTESSVQFRIFVNPRVASSVDLWSILYEAEGSGALLHKTIAKVSDLTPVVLTLDQLRPSTNYRYMFYYSNLSSLNLTTLWSKDSTKKMLGSKERTVFEFKTFPARFTNTNATMIFSSCAKTGSENIVFSEIVDRFPHALFFLQMGDIFYSDIATEKSEVLFQEAYFRMFESKSQRRLYENFPVVYMWDDHDFGDNNSGQSSLAKYSARTTYNQYVPAYPFRTLPDGSSDPTSDGIYQHTIIGQTLMIVLDMRTAFISGERGIDEKQVAWVLALIDYAKTTEAIKNVIFVSSIPWQGEDWSSFEQKEVIGAKIAQLLPVKANVLMITGDSHMVAFDNGYNNKVGGFMNIVASPMDKTPSCKGGTYTYGPYSGNGQYATLDIQYFPDSNKHCFVVKGWRYSATLFSYDTCNVNDRKLTNSYSCFTLAYLEIILTLLAIAIVAGILVIMVCIGKRFLRSMKAGKRKYEGIKDEIDEEFKDILNNRCGNNQPNPIFGGNIPSGGVSRDIGNRRSGNDQIDDDQLEQSGRISQQEGNNRLEVGGISVGLSNTANNNNNNNEIIKNNEIDSQEQEFHLHKQQLQYDKTDSLGEKQQQVRSWQTNSINAEKQLPSKSRQSGIGKMNPANIDCINTHADKAEKTVIQLAGVTEFPSSQSGPIQLLQFDSNITSQSNLAMQQSQQSPTGAALAGGTILTYTFSKNSNEKSQIHQNNNNSIINEQNKDDHNNSKHNHEDKVDKSQ